MKNFKFPVFSDRPMCQVGAVDAEVVQVRAGGVLAGRVRMRTRKFVVGDAAEDQRKSREKGRRGQRMIDLNCDKIN